MGRFALAAVALLVVLVVASMLYLALFQSRSDQSQDVIGRGFPASPGHFATTMVEAAGRNQLRVILQAAPVAEQMSATHFRVDQYEARQSNVEGIRPKVDVVLAHAVRLPDQELIQVELVLAHPHEQASTLEEVSFSVWSYDDEQSLRRGHSRGGRFYRVSMNAEN